MRTTNAARRWPKSSSVDADDRRLVDAVVLGEQLLDLAGEDVLGAGDDHLVVAAVDVQEAVAVEVADVAGGHQPVDDLLGPAARVALEGEAVVDEDAAGLARRAARCPCSSKMRTSCAGRRRADAARLDRQLRGRRDRRDGDLGRAVEVVDDGPELPSSGRGTARRRAASRP